MKRYLNFLHDLIWFLMVLTACSTHISAKTPDPVDIIIDTPLKEIEGGVRLAPPESQWDGYGEAVDVYGNLLVIGASEWNHCESGSAYVYRFSDGDWLEEAQLIASDRDEFEQQARRFEGQRFGSSVAIDDGVIVVGAPGNARPASEDIPSAVYIFEFDGLGWMETAKLTAKYSDAAGTLTQLDPSFCGRMRPRLFGALVALDGDTLAVSGDEVENSVYVYERSENGWQEQTNIPIPTLPEKELYMASMALHGDTLALSAFYMSPQPEEISLLSGSVVVYLFERTGTDWQERFRFSPDGEDTDLLFYGELNIGASVALGGTLERADLLAVGLPGFPDWTGDLVPLLIGTNPNPPEFPISNRQTGAVYLIKRAENGEWYHQATLKPAGWENPPGPGHLLAKRPDNDNEQGDFDGAAFLASTIFPGHIFSEDPEISFFGAKVALDGNRLVATAGFANATYLFEQQRQEWVYQLRITPVHEGEGMWEDFAQVVKINGSNLLLGTPGEFGNSAYVFRFLSELNDP